MTITFSRRLSCGGAGLLDFPKLFFDRITGSERCKNSGVVIFELMC